MGRNFQALRSMSWKSEFLDPRLDLLRTNFDAAIDEQRNIVTQLHAR
jgi:hypothetical protein